MGLYDRNFKNFMFYFYKMILKIGGIRDLECLIMKNLICIYIIVIVVIVFGL